MVAYSVSLRRREIGVRIALGGTSRRVTRHLVADTFLIAVLGGLIGWGLALLIAMRFAPLVRLDPVVFTLVPVILLTVAAVACWIPAYRAATMDPAVALRE